MGATKLSGKEGVKNFILIRCQRGGASLLNAEEDRPEASSMILIIHEKGNFKQNEFSREIVKSFLKDFKYK